MRRGKVPIERIQKLSRRQATFCKRRCGLFKKAQELAILCDAQVAIIAFSGSGKMYEFSSPSSSSVKMILENYGKTITQKTTSDDSHDLHINNGVEEQYVVSLQDLEHLDMRMLDELEHQLHTRQGYVREKLTQKILKQIQDLKLQERHLLGENKKMHEMIAKFLQQRGVHLAEVIPLAEAGRDKTAT